MHRARFEVALALQAQSSQGLGRPLHGRFKVDPAPCRHGFGRGFQGRFSPPTPFFDRRYHIRVKILMYLAKMSWLKLLI